MLAACAARTKSSPARDERRILHVGTSGDYPPFSEMKDEQGLEPSGPVVLGFSSALMQAYAAERGRELVWVRFRWRELVPALVADRFDLAASGITVRADRSLAGRYTVPVVRHGAVLLLRRPAWAQGGEAGTADPLTEIRALDRAALRVAVNQGGHLEKVAREHFRAARIIAIPDNAAVREALAGGEVDAALTNTVEAPRWAQGLEGIEPIGPFTRDWVALYVRADERELAADLDRWLLAKEEDGTLERLRATYLGPGATGPTALPVDALLAATAERLALMPMVAVAKARAGQPIEAASQEARVLVTARADTRHAAAAQGLPALPDDVVTAFFQAQFDAAKALQRRTVEAPVHSLEGTLRPALGRISARMSALLPRVPPGLVLVDTRRKVREALASTGLGEEELERLAEALVAVSAARTGQPPARLTPADAPRTR